MAKLSWPDMKRFCELADDTLHNFEARFKESCSQSVTMKDVTICHFHRERSHVKRAGELNLESLKMDGFDKSLYRSLARSCGCECSWAALKMAVIHKSILDEDLIVKELHSGLDGMFPATSMESLPKDGSTGFNIVDLLKMTCQLMKELYDGDTASRRYTKNYKYLFQLNCFLGQFSNERYSVLIDCLCEWLDIVPKSDQHICGDSFFLNVVITEVLIFLVEKECLVTRLNAERIVDGVFHQAS
eukprot:gene12601-13886_t